MNNDELGKYLQAYRAGHSWEDRFLAQQIELFQKDLKHGVGVLGLESSTSEDVYFASLMGIKL